jgi:hypothetical protein
MWYSNLGRILCIQLEQSEISDNFSIYGIIDLKNLDVIEFNQFKKFNTLS